MFVLQASALRFGQLSVVQPVLTGELIFLVIILALTGMCAGVVVLIRSPLVGA